MANRQFFASQMSEMDHPQIWNHQNHETRPHLENDSSMHRMNDGAVSGINSMAHLTAPRPNNYLSLGFSSDVPSYGAVNSGILRDPHLHPSSGSSSQFQSNQVLHAPSSYGRQTIRDGSSTLNAVEGNGRMVFKRKSPAMPPVFDWDHTRGYCTGTSSNLHVSPNHLQPNPMPGPQCWPLNPLNTTVPSYWSENLAGAGSQRNVRSRHSYALHLETRPAGVFSSSNWPCHFHPADTSGQNMAAHHLYSSDVSGPRLHSMANISGSNVAGHHFHATENISGLSVAGNHRHSTANISGSNVAGQCNHSTESMAPPSRILSSDSIPSYYGMNQCFTGSTVSNGATDGAYRSGLIQSRNAVVVMPTLSSYDQRETPYMPIPSHPPMDFVATSLEDAGPSRAEAVISYRHSRPLSTVERRLERNGRARDYFGRFQGFSYDDHAYSRWLPEAVVMLDPLVFYDSSDLFDQHMDMRLDIDDMSYEELLALEESIGVVSTGLPESSIPRCLIDMIYSSSVPMQDKEERTCVICLEEYKEGEYLGSLKCGHDFHSSCIRKWLLTKNACPICKAPALANTSKEKQVVSQ